MLTGYHNDIPIVVPDHYLKHCWPMVDWLTSNETLEESYMFVMVIFPSDYIASSGWYVYKSLQCPEVMVIMYYYLV